MTETYVDSRHEVAINLKRSVLDRTIMKILNSFNNYIGVGNGVIYYNMEGHFVNIATYNPLSGSVYTPLPGKDSTLNVVW